jgi:hypothetical protein
MTSGSWSQTIEIVAHTDTHTYRERERHTCTARALHAPDHFTLV